MDEAIAILKLCSDDWDELTVHALYDGDDIAPWETVMTIEGDYTLFAHLETCYLGVLARRTLISTNVRRVVDAARGSRSSSSRRATTTTASRPATATRPTSRARSASRPTRRPPGGEAAASAPSRTRSSPPTAETRCSRRRSSPSRPARRERRRPRRLRERLGATSLEVARAMGEQLWGVRLDTSRTLVDRSLWNEMGDFDPRGVNERLVRKVRDALDENGFERVKIVVSGGFDVDRIREFEAKNVPVDSYGVGSSLIRGDNDFTADIVLTDGLPRRRSAEVPAEPAARARRLGRFSFPTPADGSGGWTGSRTSSTTFRGSRSRGCP